MRQPRTALLTTVCAAGGFGALALIVARDRSAPGDRAILSAVHDVAGERIDGPAELIARATNAEPVALACAVVALWLVYRRRWVAAALVVAAVGVVAFVNPVLKDAFERPRPVVRETPMAVSRWSFPSGHAATSAAALGAALLTVGSHQRRRAVGVIGGAGVGIVAATQLVLGAHHPSDIVGGWLWVTAWISALAALRAAGPRRLGADA